MAEAIRPEAQQAMRIAIWLLFALYCSPLVIVLGVYLGTDAFANINADNPNPALEAFAAFALMGDQSLSLVHRALLPLMAGLAPIAFNDPAARRSTTALMVLLIVGIALSVFLSAVFSASSAKALLKTLSLFEGPDGTGGDSAFDSGFKLMISFFNRTQESLGMYLLMLFGLTLTRQQ